MGVMSNPSLYTIFKFITMIINLYFTGYLKISGSLPALRSFSFFENLEEIRGSDRFDNYSLYMDGFWEHPNVSYWLISSTLLRYFQFFKMRYTQKFFYPLWDKPLHAVVNTHSWLFCLLIVDGSLIDLPSIRDENIGQNATFVLTCICYLFLLNFIIFLEQSGQRGKTIDKKEIDCLY